MQDCCPQCGTAISADDFQCARCELILNVDAVEEVVTEPSVVRALLGPAQSRPTSEFPAFPTAPAKVPVPLGEEVATAEFQAVAGPLLVPRIVAGLDVAGKLDGFEAYIASFIDGAQGPGAIATVARVAEVEVQAVLRTLRERRVIDILPRAPSVPLAGPAALKAAAAPGRRAPALHPVPVLPRSATHTFSSPPPHRPAPVAATPPEPAHAPRPAPVLRSSSAKRTEPSSAPPRRIVPLDMPAASQDREENVLQHAVALERSGQFEGAIHVLKRGIERVKNPAPLYNRLALVLLVQRRDYREAEELLRKALEVEPDHAVYQANLYKVISLAAAGPRPERKSGGLLDRLIRRK